MQTPHPFNLLFKSLCSFNSSSIPVLKGRVQVLEDGTPVSLGKLFRRDGMLLCVLVLNIALCAVRMRSPNCCSRQSKNIAAL